MIQLVSHNPQWKEAFSSIRAYLLEYFPTHQIVHLGSTAIEGILTQDIIDIGIVMNRIQALEEVYPLLQLLEYSFVDGVWQSNQTSLYPHHIVLYVQDEDAYQTNLAFFTLLENNLKIRQQFQDIKVQSYHLADYQALKEKFIAFILEEHQIHTRQFEVLFPDFNQSLINLIASIQTHFGGKSIYKPLNCLNPYFLGVKRVILLVLDGMGKRILQENIEASSFLRQHHKCDLTSIYPPTTVAATTALLSGKLPGVTGWVGWHQYFAALDAHVTLFKNEDYYSLEKFTYDVGKKYLDYEPFYHQLPQIVGYELFPSFKPNGFTSFSDMGDRLIEISKKQESSYTYAYWDKPDYDIHEHGCYNDIVRSRINELNTTIERVASQLDSETLLLVTADHGLVDVEPIQLLAYPDLMACLTVFPSLEGRSTVFFVNDKERFASIFNRLFARYFDLYDTNSFLDMGLLGFPNDKARPFLGDFIAISKSKYFFKSKTGNEDFKGAHAGLTKDEMIVPLIVYRKSLDQKQ